MTSPKAVGVRSLPELKVRSPIIPTPIPGQVPSVWPLPPVISTMWCSQAPLELSATVPLRYSRPACAVTSPHGAHGLTMAVAIEDMVPGSPEIMDISELSAVDGSLYGPYRTFVRLTFG